MVGAITALAVALRPSRKPVHSASVPVSPSARAGLLTDLSMCVGCRACELACNRINKLPQPPVPFSDASVFEKERRPTVAAFTVVNRHKGGNGADPIYRKAQCMHCNEPACVSACPVAAMVKTPEGPVIWDEKVCIGCRLCMVACPFYIPTYEYSNPATPKVRKCTLCYQRVVKEGGAPACVEACPTKALKFGKRGDLITAARQRILDNPDKYVDHIYGEREVGGTSLLYISPVPFEQVGLPAVGSKAYGDLTWGYLSAIGAVDILGPLVLIGLYRISQRRENAANQHKSELSSASGPKKEGGNEH